MKRLFSGFPEDWFSRELIFQRIGFPEDWFSRELVFQRIGFPED